MFQYLRVLPFRRWVFAFLLYGSLSGVRATRRVGTPYFELLAQIKLVNTRKVELTFKF